MFASNPCPAGVVYDISAGDCAGRHRWTTEALARGALTELLTACRTLQRGEAATLPEAITGPWGTEGLPVPRRRRPPAVDALVGDACRRAGLPRSALLPGGDVDRLMEILSGLRQSVTSPVGQAARATLRTLTLTGPVEAAPKRHHALR
jgi:hypothetical protein